MKQLQKYFHTRQYRQTDTGVVEVGPRYGFGKRQWILPRCYCLFRMVRIDNIPQADLRNAIDLKILEWSPYAETGQYVAQVGNKVLVWIWDQRKHLLEAEKHGALTVPVVPETVVCQPRLADGVCLVPCLLGYEGQIWEDAAISASHWWAEPPNEEQWLRFLLRNDAPPCDLPPVSPASEMLMTPWCRGYVDFQLHLQANEHRIVKILGLALALYLIWLGGTTFKLSGGLKNIEKTIAQKEQQVEPILAYRAQALDYSDRLATLNALAAYPTQLEVIEVIIGVMPAGTQIQKWLYEQGTLTLLLQGGNPDPQALVQGIEATGLFSQVVAQRSRLAGQVDVTMLVRTGGEKK